MELRFTWSLPRLSWPSRRGHEPLYLRHDVPLRHKKLDPLVANCEGRHRGRLGNYRGRLDGDDAVPDWYIVICSGVATRSRVAAMPFARCAALGGTDAVRCGHTVAPLDQVARRRVAMTSVRHRPSPHRLNRVEASHEGVGRQGQSTLHLGSTAALRRGLCPEPASRTLRTPRRIPPSSSPARGTPTIREGARPGTWSVQQRW